MIFSCWLGLNAVLITTSILYSHYWYIFLVPLSLSTTFNCLSVFLILIFSIKNLIFKKNDEDDESYVNKSFAYLIPCYNETKEELNNTIESLKKQIKAKHVVVESNNEENNENTNEPSQFFTA